MVGVIGTLAGLLLGLSTPTTSTWIVPAIEQMLSAQLRPKDLIISRMPSDPQSPTSCPSA